MKIITFSFDDGEIYDERLCQLFRKYEIHASFGLRSGCFDMNGKLFNEDGSFFREYQILGEKDIARVYKGFEICSHGAHHRGFTKLSYDELKQEIGQDQIVFKRLTGQDIIGAIYPGGQYNDTSIQNLKRLGIKYCRATPDGNFTTEVPHDWLAWIPTCHFKDKYLLEFIQNFKSRSNSEPHILHIFGHSYELEYKDRNWWEYLEQVLIEVRKIPNAKFFSLGETYHNLNFYK